MSSGPPRKRVGRIIGDAFATTIILSIFFSLFASLILNGLAGSIQAFGDGMRWLFGQ